MQRTISTIVLAAAFAAAAQLGAATPEQEKAFVEKYRKALEAGDAKELASFLYTKGAEPEQIEFFKMMMQPDPGTKITKIELIKPTAEEAAKYNEPMEMPDGKTYKMPFTPTYALVVESETKTANESSKGSSRRPVGEKDGKLCIPVPVPAAADKEKPAPKPKAK
ncbi:MAG: hypothetical protein ACR2OZ_11040 [Verrucomicrobiales bacterium]